MYLHNPTGMVFLANMRTASNAIAKALRTVGFNMSKGGHHGSIYYPQLRYFCVVRNHWDAIASLAAMHGISPVEKQLDPKTLITILRYRSRMGVDDAGTTRRDIPALWRWVNTKYSPFILKYEELPHNLFGFLATNNIHLDTLPHENEHSDFQRTGIHYSEYYTPEGAEWVYSSWGEEIESLGYKYEETL